MTKQPFFHRSVLLEEVLANLPQEAMQIADLTLGAGGHSFAMLQARPQARLYGSDRDQEALLKAEETLKPNQERCRILHADFLQALDQWQEEGIRFDYILADLGVSSYQLDEKSRGFSFNKPGPLDMRMDQSSGPSAKELLAEESEEEIARILYEYGEERFSRRIAAQIKEKIDQLETTTDLAELIYRAIPHKFHPKKIHPATKSFQAIRIAVNQELWELEELLKKAMELLKSGARLAIITFHSLEDRMVKEAFNRFHDPCQCPREMPQCVCGLEPIAKKPFKVIKPGAEEIGENPRARSAKLRVIEKA